MLIDDKQTDVEVAQRSHTPSQVPQTRSEVNSSPRHSYEQTDVEVAQRSHTPSQIPQTHSEVSSSSSHSYVNLNRLLTQKSREELLTEVGIFAKEKMLTNELPILRRGAILAQNPADYGSLDGLTELEKVAIYDEDEHRWRHPWSLYWTVVLCSIGAVTQGWDQTGSASATVLFPEEFGISTNRGLPNATRNSWIVGAVNAAPYIGSAACGCWISDPLNNYLGRRGAIFVTALILIATPIASGFSHSWQTLFVIRLVLGIGMGAKASTIPVYAAENSPAPIRGAVVMSWQLFTAFGIFIGFVANLIVESTGKIAWRLQLGSACIPAIPLAIGIFFCPESPRWLMKKNPKDYRAAYTELCRLRRTELQAARDLYYIHVQLQEEIKWKDNQGINYFVRFAELFTIPRVRHATVAAFVVMLAQQMCGINIIAFYSSTVFTEAGYSKREALLASVGFGAVNFLFAFPAVKTIDTSLGRRGLLLLTFPMLACTTLAAGLCFLIDPGTARIGSIAFFIFLFAACYSPGEGPIPYVYSAEVFPLAQREQGMAFAVTTCLGWAAVVSITFPRMLIAFKPTGAFGFYAGMNVLAFVLIFLFVPETKKLTLEELDQVFSVPVRDFAKYQVTKVLPHFIKRWIFSRRLAPLKPLYPWELERAEKSTSIH